MINKNSLAKIVGPGNKYVTAAKLLVFGEVDIDSPAGPSEALIVADEAAEARFVAADFLSGKTPVIPKRSVSRYDLAILYDPAEKFPPSDQKALKNFSVGFTDFQ